MKKIIFGLFAIVFCGTMVSASTTISSDGLDDLFNQVDNALNTSQGLDYEELIDAVNFMHEYEMTMYDTVEDYQADRSIRRDESAKVFVKFMENIVYKDVENNAYEKLLGASCGFSDLEGQTFGDLLDLVKLSCEYGIFKGYQGKFAPTDALTNGQAVVVLMRMIDGQQDELSVDHYARNYVEKADEMGILDNLNISKKEQRDLPASRGLIAVLLYRASQL